MFECSYQYIYWNAYFKINFNASMSDLSGKSNHHSYVYFFLFRKSLAKQKSKNLYEITT